MLLLYGYMEVYSGPAIPLFLATLRCNILQLFIHKHVSLMFLIHSCLFTLQLCEICIELDCFVKHLLNMSTVFTVGSRGDVQSVQSSQLVISKINIVVTRLFAICWHRVKRPDGNRRKHCAHTTKDFLSSSKMSTFPDAGNVLTAE
jgi:hypothetical protein